MDGILKLLWLTQVPDLSTVSNFQTMHTRAQNKLFQLFYAPF